MDKKSDPSPPPKESRWTLVEENQQQQQHFPARYAHSAVVYKDRMYVFGGEDARSELLNDLWAFGLESRQWTRVEQKGERPSPRSGHTALVHGDEMFVFGGHTGKQRVNDLYAYSFATNQWRKIDKVSGTVPAPRCKHVCVELAGRMIIHGGWDWTKGFKELHAYDFGKNAWETLAMDGPVDRIWHQAVVRPKDGLYMWAGENDKTLLQNSMFRVGEDLKSWTTIACDRSPADRMGHSAAVHAPSDSMIVFGGYGGDLDRMFSDVQRFDFATRRWTKLGGIKGRLPLGVHGHSCVAHGERLLVCGGMSADMACNAQVWELALGSQLEAAPEQPKWKCLSCTFENDGDIGMCGVCGDLRPPPRRQRQQPAQGHAQAQPVPKEPAAEAAVLDRVRQFALAAAPPSAPWNCPACTYENAGGALQCEMCNTPR